MSPDTVRAEEATLSLDPGSEGAKDSENDSSEDGHFEDASEEPEDQRKEKSEVVRRMKELTNRKKVQK